MAAPLDELITPWINLEAYQALLKGVKKKPKEPKRKRDKND